MKLKFVLRYCLLILIIFTSFFLSAQKKNESFRLRIHKTPNAIKIDGVMDSLEWKDAEDATDFNMMLPMDTSHAKSFTHVRMAYDDANLYLIAECMQPLPGPYYVESLRRDFSFVKNDNFIVFIDPFDDQTNGFAFGTNAAGAQWDGMMYEGGKVDLNWDNKWISAVKNYPEKWVLEMAIPFTSIRFKKGIDKWGINFSRLDLKTAEKSAWAPVPRQFPSASLAYTGTLLWDKPPQPVGANISVIPYGLTGVIKDYANAKSPHYQKEFGADAKIALTSSLNLDLTVNPDFSQVEVDRQVTNLDRYELFFPEKRQFFLENGDIFANFGYQTLRPFFSRRIGLEAPIFFGARLSGKPDKNWRLGLMNMQTGAVGSIGLPPENFTVASVQRRVFARSNIGVIFVNKQAVNYDPGKYPGKPLYTAYNRNMGLEYNLASSNNRWTGKAMFIKSFTPGIHQKDLVHAGHLQYSGRRWLFFWQHEFVGKNYNAETGYVPRRGYIKYNPMAGYTFFAKRGKILTHGPKFNYTSFNDKSFKRTDDEIYLGYLFSFRTQSTFLAWVAHDYVKLLQPFDPTNYTKDSLSAGTEHRWYAWGTEFVSKPQSVFTYGFSTRYGGYYANGNRLGVTADIGYRFQPYLSIAINSNYNNINLPKPWGRNIFWLIGPRIDLTLTNKFFFTTFLQYNDQVKNININARLQWRYQPASDIFLVYTDNYYSAPFFIKNRALQLKVTYWWNKK